MDAILTEWTLGGSTGPVPVRIYRGAGIAKVPPVVMHLHGGTFIGGSLACGHRVASLIASAGAVVVAADYSGTTDQPFPAPLQYSFEALRAILRCCPQLAGKKSPLFVAGEEAGGNLAAGIALMARDQGLAGLKGQILLSPMLDPCMATRSFRCADAASRRLAAGWSHYLGSDPRACHPYAAPAYCSRLGGVAPALVITAEDDPMRDESLAYARRLRAAGVCVFEHVLAEPTGWPGTYVKETGGEPAWGETIRGHFAAFFDAARAPLP